MTFEQLNLCAPVLRAVTEEGYAHPTPIQEQAIPHVLAGKDLLACAQTGTGKTAAFALPILDYLVNKPPAPSPRRRTRALILTPTRELAIQIGQSFETYGKYCNQTMSVLYGGVNQNPQVKLLIHGVDIIVATPGRLLDLMDQGWADVKRVEKLVLDEADNMLDMGFILDIRKIISKTPQWRQTLLFSATMPDEIRRLANQILTEPVSVAVARVSSTAETVDQSVLNVSRQDKPEALVRYIRASAIDRMLVFTKTKQNADNVARYLNHAGIRASAIHADKTQQVRLAMITAFKSDEPPILVATDIAARGLDIDNVSHVVNYDVPHVAENYVHRIGRTGRAGATGIAVSLCDREERRHWSAIERLTRQQIRVADISEIESQDHKPRPRARVVAAPAAAPVIAPAHATATHLHAPAKRPAVTPAAAIASSAAEAPSRTRIADAEPSRTRIAAEEPSRTRIAEAKPAPARTPAAASTRPQAHPLGTPAKRPAAPASRPATSAVPAPRVVAPAGRAAAPAPKPAKPVARPVAPAHAPSRAMIRKPLAKSPAAEIPPASPLFAMQMEEREERQATRPARPGPARPAAAVPAVRTSAPRPQPVPRHTPDSRPAAAPRPVQPAHSATPAKPAGARPARPVSSTRPASSPSAHSEIRPLLTTPRPHPAVTPAPAVAHPIPAALRQPAGSRPMPMTHAAGATPSARRPLPGIRRAADVAPRQTNPSRKAPRR